MSDDIIDVNSNDSLIIISEVVQYNTSTNPGGGGVRVYEQILTSTVWTIPITGLEVLNDIVDSSGRRFLPDSVDYSTSGFIVVTLLNAISGKAYLNS